MSSAERRSLLLQGLMLALAITCLWLCAAALPAGAVSSQPAPWPPEIGKAYPDLELLDEQGRTVHLSQFRGKVLLIEPVGMSCPACQAFSGAAGRGGFGGVTPQGGLPPVADLVKQYGKSSVDDDRIELVQILFYDLKMGAPTAADAASWSKHFGFDRKKNHHVFAAPKDLQGPVAYNLIPGFQLIDKNFVLRSDSTGHNPRENLYRTLLPMIASLLESTVHS